MDAPPTDPSVGYRQIFSTADMVSSSPVPQRHKTAFRSNSLGVSGDCSGGIPSLSLVSQQDALGPRQVVSEFHSSTITREEDDVNTLILLGDLEVGTDAIQNEPRADDATVEECRMAVESLPPVAYLIASSKGEALVESGVTTNPEMDILSSREDENGILELRAVDDCPSTRGCLGTVYRAAGKLTFKVHQWVVAPFVSAENKIGNRTGEVEDTTQYDPGSGYERVSQIRASLGPRAPLKPTNGGLLNDEEDDEDHSVHSGLLQNTSTTRPPPTAGPTAGGSSTRQRSLAPMIATMNQIKVDKKLESERASLAHPSSHSSFPFRAELETILEKYGCPITVDLDLMGSGNVALTLSGPIRLVNMASGANPTNVSELDETALNMLEVLFLKHHHKKRHVISDDADAEEASDTSSASMTLCSIRLCDIDFTPTVGGGFSRRREWSKQTDPTDEETTVEEQQDEQQWMSEREEDVRSRVVMLFNSLISGCPGVASVSLHRVNITPSDIVSNIQLPGTGSLEILSLKDCGLTDSHLSAFVRLAQKNLNERQRQRSGGNSANRRRGLSSPRNSTMLTTETLLGGLKKLELLGSFSQSCMAVLLRFFREDLLTTEVEEGKATGANLQQGHHLTPRSSTGPAFSGMRLQELLIPASLSSFVRSSEFAKRLPLLLVNGRGVSVPSNRFGSTVDVSSLGATPR